MLGFRFFKQALLINLTNALFFLSFTPQAFAFCHLKNLDKPEKAGQLVHRVLKKKAIHYCFEIGTNQKRKFPRYSIKLQLESALRLWLEAAPEWTQDTVLEEVKCDYHQLDLKVLIEDTIRYKQLPAYENRSRVGSRPLSKIVINTGYESKSGYETLDFIQIFSPSAQKRFEFILKQLNEKRISLMELSKISKVPYGKLFETTYTTLIHELGHSFGLGDTYSPQLRQNCSQTYITQNQPRSVMQKSDYFYLTPDDVGGIRSLFRRFGGAKPSKP